MVEFTKKRVRRFSVKGYFLLIVFIVVIVYLIFFTGLIKKNCRQDEACFSKALSGCKAARFLNIQDNNLYEYTIKGSEGNLCVLDIKLKKMGVGTPIKLVDKFEGKSMECKIPRGFLKEGDIGDISNIINYCSGPLKEAILELIVDRMYGLIIRNIGDIAKEVRQDLFEIR